VRFRSGGLERESRDCGSLGQGGGPGGKPGGLPPQLGLAVGGRPTFRAAAARGIFRAVPGLAPICPPRPLSGWVLEGARPQSGGTGPRLLRRWSVWGASAPLPEVSGDPVPGRFHSGSNTGEPPAVAPTGGACGGVFRCQVASGGQFDPGRESIVWSRWLGVGCSESDVRGGSLSGTPWGGVGDESQTGAGPGSCGKNG